MGRNQFVVVHHDAYDGVNIDGHFDTLEAAESFATTHGGKARRVVHAGLFCLDRKFVVVEACLLGGITVHGWFPSRDAAEAYCHRQSMLAGTLGSRFAAAAVS